MVEDTERWSVRRLNRDTEVSAINCGDEPWGQSVTEFLVSDALEQQELLGSKTTLFYYDQDLVGYVTLATSVLELQQAQQVARQPGIEEIGRDLIPSVLIARFGVDKEKWLRKSEQGDKWNRCLIEGMIVLSETGARDEQTTPP